MYVTNSLSLTTCEQKRLVNGSSSILSHNLNIYECGSVLSQNGVNKNSIRVLEKLYIVRTLTIVRKQGITRLQFTRDIVIEFIWTPVSCLLGNSGLVSVFHAGTKMCKSSW